MVWPFHQTPQSQPFHLSLSKGKRLKKLTEKSNFPTMNHLESNLKIRARMIEQFIIGNIEKAAKTLKTTPTHLVVHVHRATFALGAATATSGEFGEHADQRNAADICPAVGAVGSDNSIGFAATKPKQNEKVLTIKKKQNNNKPTYSMAASMPTHTASWPVYRWQKPRIAFSLYRALAAASSRRTVAIWR